jgi:AbrB family looped-hinge helix DNA binding protein
MQTKLSTKGQVVLPGQLRRRLGITAGDVLEVRAEAGRIILTPQQRRPNKARIVVDPVTGFPALTAGPDAPILTSKDVKEILSNFP